MDCNSSSNGIRVNGVEESPRGLSGDSFIRPHLLKLPPLMHIFPSEVLSAQLGMKPEDIIKLDANENPYGPPPEVFEALAALKFLYTYPDPECRRLRAALSEYIGLEAEHILVGAGEDDLIEQIMRCVLDPGDKIVDCPPTFPKYQFVATVSNGIVIKVPRKADFSLDLEKIIEVVKKEKPKCICLTSPNMQPRWKKVKVTLVQERERLYKLLLKVPFLEPFPSRASFVLCEVTSGIDAKKLKEDLARSGIVIRHYSSLKNFVRISVGKPEHTNALMDWLNRLY